MRHLSLFSGGGIGSLAAHAVGIETVAHCENDPVCQFALRKLWPETPLFEDVRSVNADDLVRHGCLPIDIISGGFPCQDVSTAGKGAGLEGERSGLWFEMLRVIREVRPAWVLAENVPTLRVRGADAVLAGLEEAGYTCWPIVVGAWAVGAPHKRDRVWIVAHRPQPRSRRLPVQPGGSRETDADADRSGEVLADDSMRGWRDAPDSGFADDSRSPSENESLNSAQNRASGGALADGAGVGRAGQGNECGGQSADCRERLDDALCSRFGRDAHDEVQAGRNAIDGTCMADSKRNGREGCESTSGEAASVRRRSSVAGAIDLADAHTPRREERGRIGRDPGSQLQAALGSRWPSRPGEQQHDWEAPRILERGVGGTVDGVAERIHGRANKSMLRILGNAWFFPLAVRLFSWIRQADEAMQ